MARLVTLGGLRLDPPVLTRPKPLLLLAYVTIEGGASRAHLRSLFWPGEERAAANLRVTLSQLRSALGTALHGAGDHVDFRVPCDALELQEHLRAERHADATRDYAGAFLEGVTVAPDEVELEEWMLRVREDLAARVAQAHLELAGTAVRGRNRQTAARHAEAAWQTRGAPPLEVRHLQALLPILDAVRSPLAAQVRRELEELGETPQAPPPTPLVTPARLPTAVTAFVGRAREHDAITTTFMTSRARLVTVTGMGGIGKTRLAVEVARSLDEAGGYPDGVCFARLEDARSRAEALHAVAEAAHMRPDGRLDVPRILERFRDARCLLVLDNVEHLPEFAPDVEALLLGAPGVHVLVTSRAPIGVRGEWLMRLDGLAHHGLDLFLERARHAAPHVTHGEDFKYLAGAVCRSLHGVPLALELAAALLRAMPIAALVRTLAEDADALTGAIPVVATRHSGMRAVFESAWQALDTPDQDALAALGVFEGGVTLDAARAVAGLSARHLVRLVDRSLVRLHDSGRYDVHGVLLPFVRERTTACAAGEALTAAHAAYYVREARAYLHAWRSSGDAAARRALDAELPNVRAAWQWTLRHADVTACAELTELVAYFDASGRYADGAPLYEAAARTLERRAGRTATWCEFAVNAAWLQYRQGRFAEARTWADEARATATHALHGSLDAARVRAWEGALLRACNTLGSVASATGDHASAIQYGEEALTLARSHGDKAREATYLVNLGNAYSATDDAARAEHAYTQARNLAGCDLHVQAVLARLNHGHLLTFRAATPQPIRAAEMLREGRALAERTGQLGTLGYFDLYLSRAALLLGDTLEADRLVQSARRHAAELGAEELHLEAALAQARVRLEEGNVRAARDHIMDTLHGARDARGAAKLEGALLLGLIERRSGHFTQAYEYLRCVADHARALPGQRREAQQALAGCGEGPPRTLEDLLMPSRA